MLTSKQHAVIVGAGFSGIAAAIRLKQAGFHDFTILEKSHEVGGTWRDNNYPGAACDIPSHVYSYSFEANPSWTRQFSPQAEIFTYLKHCTDKYQLRSHIQFNSLVEKSQFNEKTGLWTLQIEGKKPLEARFFILGSGALSRPSYPQIPGLDSFEGALFHSAQWNHDFPLKNAKVAVIGTGASSIQIVPAIAHQVAKLSLFQRTPAWILPKPDRIFPQWERKLLARIPAYQWLQRQRLYWQFEIRAIGLLKPDLLKTPEKEALAYLHRKITDPELRHKLTPSYRMGCKRILISNDFYDALNHKNVEVITDSIAKVSPKGLITKDGKLHECDAIICATGFHVADKSAPFPIIGCNGVELNQLWSNGAEAYRGTTVAGFPNFFMLIGPNSGLGHNSMVYIIEAQVQYLKEAILKMIKANAKYVDVKREVQNAYNQMLKKRFENTVWTTGNCVSWYQGPNGQNTTLWPGFSFQFARQLKRFDIEDYHLCRL